MAPVADVCTPFHVSKCMPRSSSAIALDQLEQTCSSIKLQLQLSSDQHKLEAAAEELSHLTRKPCNRKMMMHTPGALAALVSMLQTGDSSIVRHAAAAVQNLAIEPEHCQKLVAAGCLKPLLQQLVHAPDSSEALLAAAAGALSNLAYEDSHCSTIATAPGCVERLVSLLSHDSCVVREAAASVLGKLAWEPELCKPIAGKGGCDTSASSAQCVFDMRA